MEDEDRLYNVYIENYDGTIEKHIGLYESDAANLLYHATQEHKRCYMIEADFDDGFNPDNL